MFSRSLTALLSALLILVVAPAYAQEEGEALSMDIGEQTTLGAAGVASYSVGGRSNTIDVRLTRDESRFIIVAQSAGTASLLLIMRDGTQVQHRITVASGDPEAADPSAVNVRENIRLDLYFVQLSDSYSHAIGIAFPSVIGADANGASAFNLNLTGATGGDTSTTFQLSAVSFLPRIDIAQNNGWARLYRQGTLITANNTEATFRAGGERNIVTQNTLGTQLVRIEFGTDIACKPRYDADTGRVELRITASVSDLTGDGGSGVPGRTITNIDTLVNLELGQSIVLAGFVARSENRARSGLPGLSQIPVLGALFGSHSRRFEESEGLMFVVPSVADAVPLRRRNRIEEAMRSYDDFSGGVDEVDLNDQPTVPGAN
jgi:pilus assembly protein CpaC